MSKRNSNSPDKSNRDHRANQSNPNKGTSGENQAHKAIRDNRANQLNPNHKKTK